MKPINLIRIAGIFLFAWLPSTVNAYVLESSSTAGTNKSERSSFQDWYFEPISTIQWSAIEFNPNAYVSIPASIQLAAHLQQPEFQPISTKHPYINLDPSKRFTAPEPSAWIMMVVGLLGLILVRRKNRN